MRRVLVVAVALVVLLSIVAAQAQVVVPRVAMVQPLEVAYSTSDGRTGSVVFAARDKAEVRLMLQGLLGDVEIEVLSIEPTGAPVGVRRDGYVPAPPPPFRPR